MVISRSVKGQEILDMMVKDQWLQLDPIDEKEAVGMHSHGYDLKKRGTFIRMKFRSWLGKPNPDYGYTLRGFPLSRYLMEIILDALFLVLSTRLARWAVEQFPPETIGKIFEKARKVWKRSTHKVKRDQLI